MTQESLLLLRIGVPPTPSSLRVRVWRRLRSPGAVALERSAYLLPDTSERYEDFQWLGQIRGEGRSLGPGVLGVPAGDGGFHIKAAGLVGERRYFAAKINANFPDHPRLFGRPAIQGTVVLCDATMGAPLAVMDSGSVTALRTGAEDRGVGTPPHPAMKGTST